MIKLKVHLPDYIIKGDNQQPIIVIIYNKYRFLANNRVYKIQTQKRDAFLQTKK